MYGEEEPFAGYIWLTLNIFFVGSLKSHVSESLCEMTFIDMLKYPYLIKRLTALPSRSCPSHPWVKSRKLTTKSMLNVSLVHLSLLPPPPPPPPPPPTRIRIVKLVCRRIHCLGRQCTGGDGAAAASRVLLPRQPPSTCTESESVCGRRKVFVEA